MKHVKFCPVRKKDSEVLLLFACLMFLPCVSILIVFHVKDIKQITYYFTWITISVPTALSIILLLFILSIFLLGVAKRQYCNREVAFWAVLTKKAISVVGPLYYTRIKLANVEKVFVWHTWVYENTYGERNKPKGANPRFAEVTGNNSKKFDFHSFFILVPKDFDDDLDIRADAAGKTRLTSENYKKYKHIANNKNIIMLDATEENYKYLRQVFEYTKFVGIKKYDTKNLKILEFNLHNLNV